MDKLLDWVLKNIIDLGSIVVTVILFFTTNSIKKKVQRIFKFKEFKLDKKGLANDLESTVNLITADVNNINPQDIRDLSMILRRIEDYSLNMSKADKGALRKVKSIVKKGINQNNMPKLTYSVGILLGFLKTRTELAIGII